MILGGGPNRIGQGIEFDYCCCHASFALREEGFETIMVNCNPETVSTDYDTSIASLLRAPHLRGRPEHRGAREPEGVIVQFGGQTPLNLALRLQAAGVPILGTSPDSIDLAEDRRRFGALLLGAGHPAAGIGDRPISQEEAIEQRQPDRISGPAAPVVRARRPRDGHRATTRNPCGAYMRRAVEASPDHPILIDRFLEDAFEFDVDAIGDGHRIVIGGIMQHIEEAGIHSGDSACVLPAYKITPENLARIREITIRLGMALKVKGLMNIQFAIKDATLYVLEVNPRASRTVPFVSKSIGVPLARLAARIMVGRTLDELGFTDEVPLKNWYVKEAVLPFIKFPGEDPMLGPEMRSTGEVMGIATSFGHAFAKAQSGSGVPLPTGGTAFLSVNDNDKKTVIALARDLQSLGFRIIATSGTASRLRDSRDRGGDGVQGERGEAQRRRSHQERRGGHDHQHAPREGVLLRRAVDQEISHPARRPLHHDPFGRRRGRRRNPGAQGAGAHGEVAPGIPRGTPGTLNRPATFQPAC